MRTSTWEGSVAARSSHEPVCRPLPWQLGWAGVVLGEAKGSCAVRPLPLLPVWSSAVPPPVPVACEVEKELVAKQVEQEPAYNDFVAPLHQSQC